MQTIDQFKDKVLKEYPRMTKDDKFEFRCHPGVSCFNKCCNDVNIFLTPYDIIKLKNRLGISSTEFLDKYTILPIEENMRHPIVMLQMADKTLNCNFVSDEGCTVYEDRPWACRMYPIGEALPKESDASTDEEFYFVINEPVCEGFKEKRQITVKDWIKDQGVEEYDELGRMFKEVSLHPYFKKVNAVEPVKLEMFYMVCYDIDKFRSFLFESSFLRRFDVSDQEIEDMKNDDVALLKFGFKWIKFAIFGEQVLKVRESVIKKVKNS
jgi:uncharacterized protein